ncbi:Mov34/MPN/PAD-1 family protein [Qipengyuania sp. DSG2-2]|uniref:Mov34/MPN/PAD-1 family protein n=1 Tax=Qipengyuania sp. DGS2-2 TaxID=3349631 RepID=UPI0036D29F42
MSVEVTSVLIAQLIAEARSADPNECCGMLLGEGEGDRVTAIQPAANVHSSPASHFEIDPQALIDAHRAARAGGPQVLGYYHSHPSGPPEPSATDRRSASGDGRIWAIIAGEEVRFWRDMPGRFEALSYSIQDG